MQLQVGLDVSNVRDAFGRLESVVEDPAGSLAFTTNYRYSVLDDLLGVCQGAAFSDASCGPGGKERSFTYDSLRRLATAQNPENGTIRHEYDNAGNLVKKTDGNGVVTTTSYDSLNRPLSKSYNDATPEVAYAWDALRIGSMHRVSNSISTMDYSSFDAMGRVTSSQQTSNGSAYNFAYQYNAAGGLQWERYPSQREVTSCYDEGGRVSEVRQKNNSTSPEAIVGRVTAYEAHGAIGELKLGPGSGVVTETSVYDAKRLQMRKVTAATALDSWALKLQYCGAGDENTQCPSNNGNILKQMGYGGAAWEHSYDSLNRLKLTVETVGGVEKWRQSMKYDAYGNRSVVNGAGTLMTQEMATPRVGNELDASPFGPSNRWNGAAYDNGGNQTTSWGDGTAVGASKYSYDAEGKMKRAEVRWTGSTTGVVEHGYDGEGRRVWKKVGGVVKTTFVYDAMGQMVAEYGESGVMPCTTCYLTADQLGSTRVIWGGDGAVKKLLDYAPFGEEVGANYRSGDVRYSAEVYPRAGALGVTQESA